MSNKLFYLEKAVEYGQGMQARLREVVKEELVDQAIGASGTSFKSDILAANEKITAAIADVNALITRFKAAPAKSTTNSY